MGINMPCKTVVLAGDHGLTPLLYRQMSGRAGRRGYDDVGHVIFYGIKPLKAYRLIKAPLSSLNGYFPTNTTLNLRLLHYYNQCKDKKKFLKKAQSEFQHPFRVNVANGGNNAFSNVIKEEEEVLVEEEGQEQGQEEEKKSSSSLVITKDRTYVQASFHFLFSLDYLYQKSLINKNGQPIGMANLLLHLNYAEEVLYPFIALYQTGYIHQLCATLKQIKKM